MNFPIIMTTAEELRAIVADAVAAGFRSASMPDAGGAFLKRIDLARRLGIGTRELSRAILEGRVPPPFYVGARSPRWRPEDITAWEAQGCPWSPLPSAGARS